MIPGFTVFCIGSVLLMLSIDLGWPKWVPPTSNVGIWTFAFLGEAIMFLGMVLLGLAAQVPPCQ